VEDDQPFLNLRIKGTPDGSLSFSVVAIHDGHQAEMKVNQAFTWLHDCFRNDLRLFFNAWTFEKLVSALDTRALSIRIGAEADMIIIATSATESLPAHITRWLDSIICQQNRGRALILGLAPDGSHAFEHERTLADELQSLAERWQTEFVHCADIHHHSSRQIILRRINDRFHCYPSSNRVSQRCQTPTSHPSIDENRLHMSPAQVEAVRRLAYDLWLKADRPAGKELDFWLTAEQQIFESKSS
jgi:hypothetical protein